MFTDPLDTDSDDDGVIDGEEGTNDSDVDGLPNCLDPDSDNDGSNDGTEIDQNFDPSDPNQTPPQLAVYTGSEIYSYDGGSWKSLTTMKKHSTTADNPGPHM